MKKILALLAVLLLVTSPVYAGLKAVSSSGGGSGGGGAVGCTSPTFEGDTNYQMVSTDCTVATTPATPFTAARTWTTPVSPQKGQRIAIEDRGAALTAVNNLIIAAASGQTINGQASLSIPVPNSSIVLEYDGTSAWSIFSDDTAWDGIPNPNGSQTITGMLSNIVGLTNYETALSATNYSSQSASNLYMCHVGDSTVMEGQGVTGPSYPYQLAAIMSSRGQYVNTNAWIGAGSTGFRRAVGDTRITVGSSWSYTTDTTLGGNYFTSTTTTNSLSFKPNIKTDRLLVFYPINSLGSGTLNSDGSNPQTLTESGATALGTYTYTDTQGLGYHTYNLTEVSGTFNIIGAIAWNHLNPGIIELNLGWDGSNTGDLMTNTFPWSPLNFAGTLGCNLTFLEGGVINDLAANITPATVATDLTSIIAQFQSFPGDVILQTFQPQNPLGTHLNTIAYQNTYIAMEQNLAAALNINLIDIYTDWVSYAIQSAQVPNPYYDTWVHLSYYGANKVAMKEYSLIGDLFPTSDLSLVGGTSVSMTNLDSLNLIGTHGVEEGGTNLASLPGTDIQSFAGGSGAANAQVAGTAYQNVAVGYLALGSASLATNGVQNVAIGNQSMAANTQGNSIVAVGYSSLIANTTGIQNTAIGAASLLANTTGTNNTAIGYRSGRYLITAQHVTAVGSNAGSGSSAGVTGSNNTIIGDSVATTTLTTGSNNILVGTSSGTDTAGANDTHEIAIGGLGLGSNTFEIGLSGTTTAGTLYGALNLPGLATSSAATSGTLCWTTSTGLVNVDTTLACLSSLEELKDIQGPITAGLETVNKMNPFWFKWKKTTEQYSGDKREQPGLGAHAMEKIEPRLVDYDAKGKLRGIRYQELTAVLVAAIKDQQTEIEQIKHTNEVSNDPCKAFNRFGRWIMGCK